jgi:3-deoxy-manno-octulosonate cytidylyltransferase (CMP-KDO synthetase)
MTLIERVYRQCKKANGINIVIVATDSDEIAKHVNSFGAEAIITPEECANGTERVAYAARHLADDFEIIINVQGDEPLIEPSVIEQLRQAFVNDNVMIATPITPLVEKNYIDNPNIVKVVANANDDIMYFSRSVIPYDINGQNSSKRTYSTYWKHTGLYAFRRQVLEEIRHLHPTELEELEKLEQLRWLYHGYKIKAIRVAHGSIEVNTEEDVKKVERILKNKG